MAWRNPYKFNKDVPEIPDVPSDWLDWYQNQDKAPTTPAGFTGENYNRQTAELLTGIVKPNTAAFYSEYPLTFELPVINNKYIYPTNGETPGIKKRQDNPVYPVTSEVYDQYEKTKADYVKWKTANTPINAYGLMGSVKPETPTDKKGNYYKTGKNVRYTATKVAENKAKDLYLQNKMGDQYYVNQWQNKMNAAYGTKWRDVVRSLISPVVNPPGYDGTGGSGNGNGYGGYYYGGGGGGSYKPSPSPWYMELTNWKI